MKEYEEESERDILKYSQENDIKLRIAQLEQLKVQKEQSRQALGTPKMKRKKGGNRGERGNEI